MGGDEYLGFVLTFENKVVGGSGRRERCDPEFKEERGTACHGDRSVTKKGSFIQPQGVAQLAAHSADSHV